MKTFMILATGLLFSIATMAADRRPTVTIRTSPSYVIKVDGHRLHDNNLVHYRNMHRGKHSIKVYQRVRGLFGYRLRLVSSKHFRVRNDDLSITVDRFGRIHIQEVNQYPRRMEPPRRYDRGRRF